ncbi:MAG: InlB B-repeat-containing protein [Lachnospiraceae bacterium]|nr:InlB B-repeat-containing protein [Lachnospiraceae bacterium]
MRHKRKDLRTLLQFAIKWKKWQKVLFFLSCIVVFVTTYALILPAITLEQQAAENEAGLTLDTDVSYLSEGYDISASDNVIDSDEGIIDIQNTEDCSPLINEYDTQDGNTLRISVSYGEDAEIPQGAELIVSEICREPERLNTEIDSDTGTEASDTGDKTSDNGDEVSDTGNEASDTGDETSGTGDETSDTVDKVSDTGNEASVIQAEISDTEVEVSDTEVGTSDTEAEAPDAETEYDRYLSMAAEALQCDVASIKYARFFDISILDPAGEEIQPSKGSVARVSISLEDEAVKNEALHIVHFGEQADVIKTTVDSEGIRFETTGFSVYAFVETMIEKTVLASDGNNYKISATFDGDTGIPNNAELVVSELTEESSVYGISYEEYVTYTENALGLEEGSAEYIRLFDIKLVDRDDPSIKYQPAEGKTVEVKIELSDAEDGDDLNIVHFSDGSEEGERVENTTETVDAGQAVTFEADSFSVYAVVDGSTEINARMKLEFYSKGNLIASMYVKNGDELLGDNERDPYKQYVEDIINDPGVGVLGAGEVFAGWILDTDGNYTTADIDDAMTIEQIREWAVSQDITEGETIHRFDAAICKLYTITYKDEDGTVLGMDAVPVKSSEYGTDDVSRTINMAYTPKDDVHNFEGWELDAGSENNVTSAIPSDRIYTNGNSISINGDISFTVNAPAGNWLVFDENGKGGTYNAPQFVKSDEVTAPPCSNSDMMRNGYTFGGWYDTKEHADAHGANPSVTTGRFTFGNELNQKTTLYASWIPNTRAPYTVILWGQNTERTAYEVLGSYVNNNGVVGQNIPYTVVDNGDEDYVTGIGAGNGYYTGFSLIDSDKNQQITITPEGDAVLNLHYDRILYNFKFYLYRNGSQNNRYDYANNSGSGSSLDSLVTWHSNQSQHPSVTGETIQSETVGGRTYYYFVMSAYYGENISSKWPTYDKITGANGREAVSYVMMVGTKLKPNPTNSGSGTVKGLITVMDENILGATNNANGNYVIIRFPGSYYNWRYHIWFETVEGEDYTGKTLHTHNGKTYYEETVLSVRSSNTTDANQNEPKYEGYDFITRLGQNTSGTVWQGEHWTTGNNPTLYHLNYIYDRKAFKIRYFDGSYVSGNDDIIQNRATQLLHESDSIAHGAAIPDTDKEYVPELPSGEEGYIFEGWYLDESCSIPYTWTTMPIGGIKVYAKWRQVQYRVFLHPNAGTDPSLQWGSDNVSTSFRVSYGGKVSTPTGTRENSGYEFVGWYTDPSLSSQYLYNSDTVLNDETVTTPYDRTEDTELDKWGNVIAGSEGVNADSDRPWITRKLDLYAKWRKILEGAGINIVYTADDGQGNVGSNAPVDQATYPDQADASAQAACTPPDGLYFKHWVIQTWDEAEGRYVDTEFTVHPGQQFSVKEEYAHKEAITGTTEYRYTMQLRAEYGQPGDGAQTHIWWFDNYSADNAERHESSRQDENFLVNVAQIIKEPPTREGFTFLGWARIPRTTSESEEGTPPTGKVLDLTEDDLYLKYESGQFKLNDSTSDDNGKVVTHVAADEKLSYHDMYAVWEKNTYKVTIKKVVLDTETSDVFAIGYSFDNDTLQPGSVNLAHDASQELSVDVPYGTVVTVSENAEGYDAVFSAIRTTDDAGTELENPVTVNEETDASGAFKIKGNTTITVTNTPQAKKVKIYKTDNSMPAVPLSNVGFTLNDRSLSTDSDGYTDIVTLYTSDTPYRLSETVPLNDYYGLSEDVLVTVSATGITVTGDDADKVAISDTVDAEGAYTITVVNTIKTTPLKVVKTDQAKKALAGAQFSEVSGGLIKNGPVTTVITGEPGAEEALIVEDNAVPLGTYTIREDSTPAGYNQLSGDVTIVLTTDQTTGQVLANVTVGGEESPFADAHLIDVNNPELGWIVTIKNDSGVCLPNTGGPGTNLLYLLGIMLTGIAGVVLLIRRYAA